mgnify:FL=1
MNIRELREKTRAEAFASVPGAVAEAEAYEAAASKAGWDQGPDPAKFPAMMAAERLYAERWAAKARELAAAPEYGAAVSRYGVEAVAETIRAYWAVADEVMARLAEREAELRRRAAQARAEREFPAIVKRWGRDAVTAVVQALGEGCTEAEVAVEARRRAVLAARGMRALLLAAPQHFSERYVETRNNVAPTVNWGADDCDDGGRYDVEPETELGRRMAELVRPDMPGEEVLALVERVSREAAREMAREEGLSDAEAWAYVAGSAEDRRCLREQDAPWVAEVRRVVAVMPTRVAQTAAGNRCRAAQLETVAAMLEALPIVTRDARWERDCATQRMLDLAEVCRRRAAVMEEREAEEAERQAKRQAEREARRARAVAETTPQTAPEAPAPAPAPAPDPAKLRPQALNAADWSALDRLRF